MKFMQMSQRQGAWNKSLSQAAPPEQTSAWKKKPSQPFVPASSSTPSSSSTQTTQANAAVYAAGSLPLNSPALRLWVQQQVANFKPDFAGLIDLFVTNPDDAEVQSIAEGVLGTSPRLSIFLKHLFLYRGPASNSGSSGKNADAGDKSKIASPSKPAGGSGGPTPAASELSLRTLQRQPSTDILNSSASPIEVPSLSGVGGPKKLSPEETSMAAVSAAGAFPSLDVKVSKNTENIHLYVSSLSPFFFLYYFYCQLTCGHLSTRVFCIRNSSFCACEIFCVNPFYLPIVTLLEIPHPSSIRSSIRSSSQCGQS